mmetsp:Transcript_26687/g.42282  ORF Transcript_26687/g.42282 Transcript_26687/m.42282 type:complete len:226 (-) Transcript_26687:607-1284(-)
MYGMTTIWPKRDWLITHMQVFTAHWTITLGRLFHAFMRFIKGFIETDSTFLTMHKRLCIASTAYSARIAMIQGMLCVIVPEFAGCTVIPRELVLAFYALVARFLLFAAITTLDRNNRLPLQFVSSVNESRLHFVVAITAKIPFLATRAQIAAVPTKVLAAKRDNASVAVLDDQHAAIQVHQFEQLRDPHIAQCTRLGGKGEHQFAFPVQRHFKRVLLAMCVRSLW